MSNYEVCLLGGSIVLLFGLVMFFNAAWQDGNTKKGLLAFVFSGVLLFFADQESNNGINPGDIPTSVVKLVQQIV